MVVSYIKKNREKFKSFIFYLLIFLSLMVNSVFVHAEVSFLAMGDSPYTGKEFYLIDKELENISRDTNFLIHLGDMKKNETNCDEKDYKDFRDLLKKSPVPVFIIPGDNDYFSCENRSKAKNFWDQYISEFEKHWQIDFLVKRQETQKENFAFILERTIFVGINLFKKKDRSTVEFNQLLQNNISWIKENLNHYKGQIESLVVFAHDFSGLRNKNDVYFICQKPKFGSWNLYKYNKYFSDQFVSLANEFNKPILYVQGNHHCWTHDFPYKEAPNIERIVVDRVVNSSPILIRVMDDKFLIDQRKSIRIDFLLKEANYGNVLSQYILGEEYLKIKDYKNAKKWLSKASKKNYFPAILKLGIIASEQREYFEAFELFKSLTQEKKNHNIKFEINNDSRNQTSLYENRIKELKNPTIKQASIIANFHLGNIYYSGLGRPRDYNKALDYFEKASEGGIPNAAYNIALMYYRGIGVKKDFKKSIIWFKKAASKSVIHAFNKLGVIYLKGQGVKQNYNIAVKWFKFAQGDGPSLYNLGVLYFKGLGVKQDQSLAINYFKKAAMVGNQDAKKILEKLIKAPTADKLTNP
jgi:uncharacterized protein